MIYLERWKIYLIVAVCVLGVLYGLPNAMGRPAVTWLQAHTPSFFPNQTVNLGLDLRGGSHLLLEVATDAVIDEQTQSLVDQTRTELRKVKIGYTDLGLVNGALDALDRLRSGIEDHAVMRDRIEAIGMTGRIGLKMIGNDCVDGQDDGTIGLLGLLQD